LTDIKYYYPNLIEIGVKSTMGKIDTKHYSNTMHPNNYYVTYRWAAYMPLNQKKCGVISRVRVVGLLVCG
jgi:hypothetical protein